MRLLEGAHRDLKQMEELLAKAKYEVHSVEVSADILRDIRDIMGTLPLLTFSSSMQVKG